MKKPRKFKSTLRNKDEDVCEERDGCAVVGGGRRGLCDRRAVSVLERERRSVGASPRKAAQSGKKARKDNEKDSDSGFLPDLWWSGAMPRHRRCRASRPAAFCEGGLPLHPVHDAPGLGAGSMVKGEGRNLPEAGFPVRPKLCPYRFAGQALPAL